MKHTYGNASQVTDHLAKKPKRMACGGKVKKYADGGEAKKGKKMKPPQKGGKPQRITTQNPPGGPYTPGAKKKAKKMADGGQAKKKAKKKTTRPKPEMLGSGMAAKAGRDILSARERREREAGLY